MSGHCIHQLINAATLSQRRVRQSRIRNRINEAGKILGDPLAEIIPLFSHGFGVLFAFRKLYKTAFDQIMRLNRQPAHIGCFKDFARKALAFDLQNYEAHIFQQHLRERVDFARFALHQHAFDLIAIIPQGKTAPEKATLNA